MINRIKRWLLESLDCMKDAAFYTEDFIYGEFGSENDLE
jgi:hypothetical protein